MITFSSGCQASALTEIVHLDGIFKLSSIHALVIFLIPWVRWIPWISIQFRENSIVSTYR